jgi:hypothetical protein
MVEISTMAKERTEQLESTRFANTLEWYKNGRDNLYGESSDNEEEPQSDAGEDIAEGDT